MKNYFKWLIYYTLNFISATVNLFLSFFGCWGKCKIEEDFLFSCLDKKLAKLIKEEQDQAEKNLQEVRNKIQK